MNRRHWMSAVAGTFALAGCAPPRPWKLGFVGGLSDRNADNGLGGQNAVVLAVEQFNRDGGLDGRMVELASRDDAQDKAAAVRAARELVDAKVEAVIGPFTSAMAAAIVPITGAAGIFQVSPTITSRDFFGKDDKLFRINRTTRDNAGDHARVMLGRGQRRIAVACDTRNRSFSERWLSEFRTAVAARQGALAAEVPHESRPDADFAAVLRQMLAGRPDSLFFVASRRRRHRSAPRRGPPPSS